MLLELTVHMIMKEDDHSFSVRVQSKNKLCSFFGTITEPSLHVLVQSLL
jgi:hypothetical protein